jgi:hypothetical protein
VAPAVAFPSRKECVLHDVLYRRAAAVAVRSEPAEHEVLVVLAVVPGAA